MEMSILTIAKFDLDFIFRRKASYLFTQDIANIRSAYKINSKDFYGNITGGMMIDK